MNLQTHGLDDWLASRSTEEGGSGPIDPSSQVLRTTGSAVKLLAAERVCVVAGKVPNQVASNPAMPLDSGTSGSVEQLEAAEGRYVPRSPAGGMVKTRDI